MRLIVALLTFTLWLAADAGAQPSTPAPSGPNPASAEARRAEIRAALEAAQRAAVIGPAVVPLSGEAKLNLPPQMAFIPQAEAARLSRAFGNQPGTLQVGIVTRFDDNSDWLVVIRWVPDGYVRDDEAKDIDADEILKGLREGTEEGNKDRTARGFPPLEVSGWIQQPTYDAANHRLSWAARVKEIGEPDDQATVNFNTRALGREGYFSLNLLTGVRSLERDRAVSATLLSDLAFDPGKRYADFNASTDHVAEYGLAALLGVVAVKKLGLLALAGLFLAKFAKLGVLALAGAGYAVRKLFRRTPAA